MLTPSPQELIAAQRLQGVPEAEMFGALSNALTTSPQVSLSGLIAAHKMLQAEAAKKQVMQAQAMAAQGSGLPGMMPQQQGTVAQQVAQALANTRAEVAQTQPQPHMDPREGGVTALDAGNVGEHYNTGGIVAFAGESAEEAGGLGQLVSTPDELDALGAARDEARQRFISATPPGTLTLRRNPAAGEAYEELRRRYREADERLKRALPSSLPAVTGRPMYGLSAVAPAVPALAFPSTNAPTAPTTPAAPAAPPASGHGPALVPPPQDTPPVRAPAAAPARPAAPAAPTRFDTSAIDARFRQEREELDEEQRRAEGMLSELDNRARPSLQAITAEQAIQKKAALAAEGIPDVPYKERIDKLASEAGKAKQERDVDRLLAAAQGFFAMGASKSPYALQAFSEGLGITAKELRGVEADYRKAEAARLDKMEALKQAHRAEVLGDQKLATELYDKALTRDEQERESTRRFAGGILTNTMNRKAALTQSQATITSGLMQRDASLASTAAQREQTAAYRQAQLEETRRRNLESERQRIAKFYLDAQKAHPLMEKNSALQTALTALEQLDDQLAAPGKSKDPTLLTKREELATRIVRYKNQVDNDSMATARRMMGSGFTYLGEER